MTDQFDPSAMLAEVRILEPFDPSTLPTDQEIKDDWIKQIRDAAQAIPGASISPDRDFFSVWIDHSFFLAVDIVGKKHFKIKIVVEDRTELVTESPKLAARTVAALIKAGRA